MPLLTAVEPRWRAAPTRSTRGCASFGAAFDEKDRPEQLATAGASPDQLITERRLLCEMSAPRDGPETNYLGQCMARLRRRLEPGRTRPRHLLTEPGMRYRYQP
nr:hypothetical protein [uncultured Actinoplanes sp.]